MATDMCTFGQLCDLSRNMPDHNSPYIPNKKPSSNLSTSAFIHFRTIDHIGLRFAPLIT